MSLNQSYAMDQKRVKAYGRIFGSIDFEVKDGIAKEVFTRDRKKTIVGTIHLDGRSFDLTLAEIQRIAETCNNAADVVMKKYRLSL